MIALWLAGVAGAVELSGTLVDADGAPIEEGVVVAYDQRFGYLYAVTDAEGAWTITGLPPNPYRVRFLAPHSVDAAEGWWDSDAFDVCASPPIELVDGRDVRGVDRALPRGATIVGTVLGGDGQPHEGMEISAHGASGLTEPRLAETDASGRFTLTGLAPEEGEYGRFVVEVDADGHPVQLVGGTYDADDATQWILVPGDVEDLGTFGLLPGITVEGTVYGPDGRIPEGWAYVYTPSQVVVAEVVDGAYRAQGLPPGSIIAWADADGHATTYAPDLPEPGDPVATANAEGDVVTGVDLTLPNEAKLVGRVVGEGDLEGANVLAYAESHLIGLGALTDADGRFEIGRLHGGRYELYAWASEVGRIDGYVEDSAGEPALIDVPAQGTSAEIVVDFPRGGVISGVVRDKYTDRAVYGATVVVSGLATGESASTTTDHDGYFALEGLIADQYLAYAGYDAYCAVDNDWVTIYHPDALWDGVATRIGLGEGSAVTWDPVLPPDDDHDGMDDVWESKNGLDPETDDGALDADGDGYTNLEEYLQGTDPQDVTYPPGEGPRCGCAAGPGAAVAPWGALTALAAVRRRRKSRILRTTEVP